MSKCFLFLVPGPVISEAAFSFGQKFIQLRWKRPYPPLGQLEKYKLEYKLRYSNSYMVQEIGIHRKCYFWDEFICAKLNGSHGIAGDKDYDIRVSGIAGIFIMLEN